MVTTYPLPTLLTFRTVQLVSAGGLAHTLATARPWACPVVILVDAQAMNRAVDATIESVASGRTEVSAIGRLAFWCCVSLQADAPESPQGSIHHPLRNSGRVGP